MERTGLKIKMNSSSENQRSTKELTDEILGKLGNTFGAESFSTDPNGLAKLSVSGVGLVDFEIFEEQRMLSIFIDVGRAPDDLSALLRAPLEHVEMAGFSFCLDGFRSQALLSASFHVDGMAFEIFLETYGRMLACARYWRKQFSEPAEKFSQASSLTGGAVSLSQGSSFITA